MGKENEIMIKVSIVVPVCNAAPFLRECMDSLVRQTLEEIEIICVNDGSTDDSLQILKKYASQDNRIRIFDKTNSGYGHAVNTGMQAARGKYIGIVEPDDFVRHGMYERLYVLAEKLNLDIIKADFYRFSGEKRFLKTERVRLSGNAASYRKVYDPKQNTRIFRFVMNTWTGIYKREFLEKYQIRHHETPGASFQDLGFWFQTFCLAKRIYFLDEPFYMYRADNPSSSVHNRKKIYAVCEEYQFMRTFLEQNSELKKRYFSVYMWKKFQDYEFAMGRIEEKYQKEFLWQFRSDFKEAQENGELSRKYFGAGDWRLLQRVIYSPEKYLRRFCWYHAWYKVRYYKEHYGTKRTLEKIIETIMRKNKK